MKYANRISEMLNAFSPEPLKRGQMAEFYCEDTMEYRTSDKYNSPMEDIFDGCQESENYNAFLLLAHRGCGKSTELNRMSERLIEEGYYVRKVYCSKDLNLHNIAYSDLFILMGETLLEIAKESECEIENEFLEDIKKFWREGTETVISQEVGAAFIEAGVSLENKGILANVLNIFAKIKTDLKFNEEIRKEYRRKISVCTSEWIEVLGHVADKIAQKANGKRPIIIFEDLDRLNLEEAWKIFHNYAALLSGMRFPVIYTFPIFLCYDTRFSAMEEFFIIKTLPMIKIETIEGTLFHGGINIVKEIVEKRANLSLFDEKVLDKLIQYTGGNLRDLFCVINASAKRAGRRDSDTISMEDAQRALEELKSSLTRRIEQKDYQFLLNIYNGNKERIEDKEMLQKMLQASVVLEYNGKRWHNVHPLVVTFLREQGLIQDAGE